jgi:hypothetical protein
VAGVVALGVVAEDAIDPDAVPGVPGDGAFEERGAGEAVVAWEQLGVGEAGVVVDRHVKVQPARALALG